MNYTELKAELDSGTYSADPQIATEELNALTVTSYQEIISGNLRGYLASIGKLFEIKQASENENHPLRDVALAVMLTMQPNGGIDFSDPANVAMLAGLKAGFGLTDEQEVSILALGEIKISRAQALGLGRVRAGDVEKARAL